MSFKATAWVLECAEAKLGPRLMLIALSEHADDDGTKAFPSIETLMKKSRLSRRSAQEALRRLEKDGEIERTGSTRYGTNIYRIVGLAEGRGFCASGARDSRGGGADSARALGADSAPNSSNRPSNLSGKNSAEPIGFEEWLGHHCELTGQAIPGALTKARTELARKFGELLGEGRSLDDLKLASVGAHADQWRRENGKDYPSNVLVFSKIDELIDKGRKAKPQTGGKRFERKGPRRSP